MAQMGPDVFLPLFYREGPGGHEIKAKAETRSHRYLGWPKKHGGQGQKKIATIK
jgi:hypothetical protein